MDHPKALRKFRRRKPQALDGLLLPISRPPLSQEVRRQLLELISEGRLPAEEQVFEADLARRLGVSRTPLHEAMVGLERDGLVESLGRRGWRIAPVREADAREIYPVLGSLEALAVSLAGSSLLGAADELRAIAHRVESALLPAEQLALENEWHSVVISQCPNQTLVSLMKSLATRASRLERLSLRQGWTRVSSELPTVSKCLARGDLRAASRLLEIHWRDRCESLSSFVRELEGLPMGSGEEPEPIPGAA